MKVKICILSLVFSIISTLAYTQNARVKLATKMYEYLAYVDAIKIYEQIAAKGYKDEEMFKKLSNAYYFNAEFLKASMWYEELFALNANQEPKYYFRYSQTLKSIGNYDKADVMYNLFLDKSGNKFPVKKTKSDYLQQIELNSGRYTIQNSEVNSKYSDYGASLYQDKIIFTSARRNPGPSKNVFSWTNNFFSNLYQSDLTSNGELTELKPFKKNINSRYNESSPVFTKDGLTMYFTRNNYLKGKRGSNQKEITLLKLYKATMEEGKWVNITELPFNSNEFSCAHPALSIDDKTLYFASNMPGTIGESDLFKVKISDDGTYGKPENLGEMINTIGRETFPFITDNNELYFSSNGHLGLGGLDIFVTSLNSTNEITNVGAPVNSIQDDFAFYIDTKTNEGFFSSNREGGKGEDDIYKLTEIQKINNISQISGLITDKESQQKIPTVKMSVFDKQYKLVLDAKSDVKGLYEIDLTTDNVYNIRFEKEGYITKEVSVEISNIKPLDKPIVLEKKIKPVSIGTDLASTLNIPQIFFDIEKWNVRHDSEFQLQKIVELLIVHPTINIEIRSHTDSRGVKDYNLLLSNKRAKATKEKLVKMGVDPERLKAKGFGESELINDCSDEVKCSEEEHQINRRSEFVIINIK